MDDSRKDPKEIWAEVRKAIEADDKERLAELKCNCIAMCERNMRKCYLQRLSIQSIYAATYADVLMALDSDWENPIAQFKYQILLDISMKHGLRPVTAPEDIQPGDTVVTTWTYKKKGKTKTGTNTFRVIERKDKSWLIALAMYENWDSQFEAHQRTEEITKKNFLVGVRQAVPPIMKKQQKFYFLNFE